MAKDRSKGKKKVSRRAGEPVPRRELDEVRAREAGQGDRPNILINTLNVFTRPLQGLIDPVKRVCYPPLEAHWERKYRRFSRHSRKMLILDLLLVTALSALVVLWIFAEAIFPAPGRPEIVSLTASWPERVESGAPLDLTLSWKNDSSTGIADAALSVELPSSFRAETVLVDGRAATAELDDLLAATSRELTLDVGAIPAGREGQAVISGRLFGSPGTSTELIADMHYWEEGRTEPSRAALVRELTVTDSPLSAMMETDEDFLQGRNHALRLTLHNGSAGPLDDLVLQLEPPQGFTVTGADIPLIAKDEWDLPVLEPDGSVTVTIYGVLRGSAYRPVSTVFRARCLLREGEERYLLLEARHDAVAEVSGFNLNYELLEPAGATALAPGQEVRLAVRHRNGGDRTLRIEKLTARPGGPFTEAADRQDGPEYSAADPLVLSPGEEYTTFHTYRIRDRIGAEDLQGEEHAVFTFSTEATYRLEDDPFRTIQAETEPLVLPVASSIGVEAGTFYLTRDGDQLGSGPLPPRVGDTTRYRIFIHVTNGANAVEGALFEAQLPPDVVWTGRASVSAGEPLAYIPSSGRLRWRIGELPPFADGQAIGIGASFEVAITPEAEDIGTAPVLVEQISLTGRDSFTGMRLTAAAEDATTYLTFDPFAHRTGEVIGR